MHNYLAQQVRNFPPFTGIGPLGTSTNASNNLARVISVAVGVLTIVAGIWFLIQLVISGIHWISSKGDKNTLAATQARMTNAVIGLLIVVLSYAFVSLIGQIIGYGNIFNLNLLIETFRP